MKSLFSFRIFTLACSVALNPIYASQAIAGDAKTCFTQNGLSAPDPGSGPPSSMPDEATMNKIQACMKASGGNAGAAPSTSLSDSAKQRKEDQLSQSIQDLTDQLNIQNSYLRDDKNKLNSKRSAFMSAKRAEGELERKIGTDRVLDPSQLSPDESKALVDAQKKVADTQAELSKAQDLANSDQAQVDSLNKQIDQKNAQLDKLDSSQQAAGPQAPQDCPDGSCHGGPSGAPNAKKGTNWDGIASVIKAATPLIGGVVGTVVGVNAQSSSYKQYVSSNNALGLPSQAPSSYSGVVSAALGSSMFGLSSLSSMGSGSSFGMGMSGGGGMSGMGMMGGMSGMGMMGGMSGMGMMGGMSGMGMMGGMSGLGNYGSYSPYANAFSSGMGNGYGGYGNSYSPYPTYGNTYASPYASAGYFNGMMNGYSGNSGGYGNYANGFSGFSGNGQSYYSPNNYYSGGAYYSGGYGNYYSSQANAVQYRSQQEQNTLQNDAYANSGMINNYYSGSYGNSYYNPGYSNTYYNAGYGNSYYNSGYGNYYYSAPALTNKTRI